MGNQMQTVFSKEDSLMKTYVVVAISERQLLFGFVEIFLSDVALCWRVNEVLQRQSTFIQDQLF